MSKRAIQQTNRIRKLKKTKYTVTPTSLDKQSENAKFDLNELNYNFELDLLFLNHISNYDSFFENLNESDDLTTQIILSWGETYHNNIYIDFIKLYYNTYFKYWKSGIINMGKSSTSGFKQFDNTGTHLYIKNIEKNNIFDYNSPNSPQTGAGNFDLCAPASENTNGLFQTYKIKSCTKEPDEEVAVPIADDERSQNVVPNKPECYILNSQHTIKDQWNFEL